MKKKDLLHQLIHSLTKSEKRNFKLFLSKYKSNTPSNSVKLFDVLNAQINYNEVKIKKIFKGQKLGKNLTYEKYKLQQLILDFLAYQGNSSDPVYKLNLLRNQIIVLVNKQQWELCIKLVERAIKIAEENGLLLLLYSFYKTRIDLTIWEEGYEASQRNNLLNKLKETQEQLVTEDEYYRMHTQVIHTVRFENTVIDSTYFDWLTQSPYFQEEERANTFETKLYLYDTKASYFEIIKDFNQVCICQEKILYLFENYPNIILKQLYNFFVYHFNYVRVLLISQKIEKAEQHLKHIQNHLYQKYKNHFDQDISNAYEGFYTTLELDLLRCQKNYIQIYDKIKIEWQTNEHKFAYNEYRKVETYTFLIMSCFALKKYQEVIDYFEELNTKVNLDLYHEEYFASKISVFFSHYELKNTPILNTINNALYYYCRKHQLHLTYHKVVLKLLRKLTQANDNNESLNFFLTKIKEELNQTHFHLYMGADLVLFWVQNKIE